MHAKIKMDLLKKLMDEMDDSVMSKIPSKKGEPSVEVTKIEQEAMPISDLKKKMGEAMEDEPEEEKAEDMAAMMGGHDDDEMSYNPDDSSLIRRMKEAKRAKKAG